VLVAVVVVVVAEHGDLGDGDVTQLACQDTGLVGDASLGEVAGDEQDVGPLAQPFEGRTHETDRVGARVDVAERRQPDHDSVSTAPGLPYRTTAVSLCTS